jgi:hypothetical protein
MQCESRSGDGCKTLSSQRLFEDFLTLWVPASDGLIEEWNERKKCKCSVNRDRAAAARKGSENIVLYISVSLTKSIIYIMINHQSKKLAKIVKKSCQKVVKKLSKSCLKVVKKKLSKSCQKLSKSCQKVVKKLIQKVVKKFKIWSCPKIKIRNLLRIENRRRIDVLWWISASVD